MVSTRSLGRSGIQVMPLAFGGNVFGWTVDQAQSFRLLDAWVDAGFNLIDTADVYSSWAPGNQGGESETIIGNWLQASGKRDKVVIATKVGKPMGPDKKGLRPAYIRQAVEASLQRLKTDRIDLYQSHDDDADTPLADTLGAFADLIREGKVRAIGASNYSGARLSQALAESERLGLPRYETLQPLYNLYDRQGFETDLLPVCQAHGVGVLTFYALAAGFLSGKYRKPEDAAKSARGTSTIGKYLNPRGLAILDALDTVAARHGCAPAQVAIAWQLAKPGITAPIASATTLEQLKDLVSAVSLKLNAEDVNALDQASDLKVP
ncbi:aldo/keto reductase [Hydrogenophaga sp.]|uniref:aldo/keto reductase n=1 Tax=Hydrogenophaga sp. TaxID=1904254 RepID=UPI00260B4018|nr:aldo/keto reductase [Hydrogenophaga sp.]MCW5654340.1 aldo/keto reductase [Hydrogenophaga sp.]